MKVFNTEFEVSMRLLLLLNCMSSPLDEEKILYLDFIAVNAKNYKFNRDNLNGDGQFMLNELSTQHSLIKESLKSLVLQNLIYVKSIKTGFVYSITTDGKMICDSMQSDYSSQYKINARIVSEKIGDWSITKIKNFAKEMEEDK